MRVGWKEEAKFTISSPPHTHTPHHRPWIINFPSHRYREKLTLFYTHRLKKRRRKFERKKVAIKMKKDAWFVMYNIKFRTTKPKISPVPAVFACVSCRREGGKEEETKWITYVHGHPPKERKKKHRKKQREERKKKRRNFAQSQLVNLFATPHKSMPSASSSENSLMELSSSSSSSIREGASRCSCTRRASSVAYLEFFRLIKMGRIWRKKFFFWKIFLKIFFLKIFFSKILGIECWIDLKSVN